MWCSCSISDRESQAGEGDSSTEEYGVTMAASVAAYLLRQQELSVGLYVSGSAESGLALDRGERQLDRVLELLAVAHATRRVSLTEALATQETRLARNTVLVVITPSTELDWPEALHHLQRRGVRPLVILMDPSVVRRAARRQRPDARNAGSGRRAGDSRAARRSARTCPGAGTALKTRLPTVLRETE